MILGFLELGITNAGPEGANHLIKDAVRWRSGSATSTTNTAEYGSTAPDATAGVSQHESPAPRT